MSIVGDILDWFDKKIGAALTPKRNVPPPIRPEDLEARESAKQAVRRAREARQTPFKLE